MKNKIALMVVVLSLLGCSDGVLKLKPKLDAPNPAASLPEGLVIKSFAADPLTMNAGGEAKLTWEVTGADSIDITSSNTVSGFHFTSDKAEDLKSSTKVTVKETTTFTLTATKKAVPAKKAATTPAPKPTAPADTPKDQTVQKTVTITVKSALSIENFYAEADKGADKDSYVLEPGKQTVLHWSVLPAEAEISLTSSTSEQPVLGECKAPTTKAMEAAGDAAPKALPVSGCATVTPSEDTVYTLSAKLGAEKQEKALSIIVGNAPKITLTATKINPKMPSVQLDWQVSAKDAKVTLTASPALPDVVKLPVDQAVDANGKGSFIVLMSVITQPTTFTVTTKVEGKTAQATVVVSPDVFGFDCSQFVVTAKATGPIFVGEQVALTITAPQGATVRVTDGSGEAVTLNPENLSIPAKVGIYTAVLYNGERALCSKPINLPVAELKKVGSGKALRVVVADSKKPNDVYVGLDKGSYNGGKMSLIHYTDVLAQTMDVDFFTALKGIDQVTAALNPNFMDKVIQTFPVNAVAVSLSGRLFAATTGGIFYKGDDGKWAALTSLLRQNNNGDYPGSHPTCFGQTQSGKQKGVKGEIVTLGQVCDLVTSGDKLYAATDRGVYYLDNVEAYIKSKGKSEPWKGWKNSLYGTVVNDIAVDGSNLYAGGANGVFESTDGGENWNAVGNIGAAVYSVTVDSGGVYSVDLKTGPTLLAGTDNGVFSYVNGQTTWNAEGKIDGRVYSIATDPYSGSIYVGSANGFYVSRDGGSTFNKVSGDAVVRSISVGYTADPSQGKAGFAIYLATEGGVMNASVAEVKMDAGTAQSTPATPTQPVPVTPSATGNVSQ